ncbi:MULTISPECIES: conjugal transfer protein TraN [Vibrio]|uniref:Conjugal transfer protein TraN n=1 Tax=Vibrio vulnificus TaxID=672 RepID=A0A2S3R2H7_VIBVL|nr:MULTISPECIES: conjugal transfer protein TraN [Vibrio]MCZ2799143.1 conjugal transfer protein TraN [Vibrio alginolyticus]POB47300.1 hypothetical protein CRN52_14560 [Vibrio vulnificus]
MRKTFKQIIVTYFSMMIMLLQGVNSVSTPYRALGLVVQATKVISNPWALGLGGGASIAASTLYAPEVNAAPSLSAPETSCPDGYSRSGSQCILKETTPILEGCSTSGYTPTDVYMSALGIYIDSCVKYFSQKAAVLCATNEEPGGTNGQQCRTVSNPLGSSENPYCPAGKTLSNGKCRGAWYTPSTSSYVCPDLCNVPLSSPTASCPASEDPIENIDPITAKCTAKGVAEGYCYSGEIVQLDLPNLDWSIESPVTPMTASDPVMCYRSAYESVVRQCPTPNASNPSKTQPEWETPTGTDSENPNYYDSESGVVTTCIRTWYEDLINTCAEGLAYDSNLGACVNEASVTCPSGYSYSNGQCISPSGSVSCTSDRTYDAASGTCVLNVDDPASFEGAYAMGADFGFAVGGVQKNKTQSADQSGNVTLDMGLLNSQANAQLQSNTNISSVSTIGENDATNNSYADISGTYWNESAQTKAITTNYNSYQSYLADTNGNKTPNLAAEAYAVVDDTIDKNRPSGIDPTEEWLTSSQDIYESVADGTNTYFGDCSTAATTKTVLDTSKQVVTYETCNKPVVSNYNSCQVKRKVTEPNLKIIEGADNANVQILSPTRIRLTLGKDGDNYLHQNPGEACSIYDSNIVLKFANDIDVKSAVLYRAVYDDIFVLSADGNEIYRGKGGPWASSGFPTTSTGCELSTSWVFDGQNDVTSQFQTAIRDDSEISFNYKVGVAGDGEAFAYVDVEFNKDIYTDWEFENIYEPEGCLEKIQSNYYTTSGWECDLGIDQDRTIGMEDWIEWDNVKNWNISNGGYDATSTQNGPWSAYGSADDVGEIWFEGNITMPGSDDDTFGFIVGYPETPIWNKDPKSDDYVPGAADDDNNHYYMILWTGNTKSNGAWQGLHMVKSYANYRTLEGRFGDWGINFPVDKYETDAYGNSALVVDNIYSNTSLKWANNKKYKFEIHQDEYGYFYFIVDGTKYIDFTPTDHDIKTGRFAFTSVSLQYVKLTGLTKKFDLNMPALFDGDTNPSICMVAHAKDVTYDPLNGGKVDGLSYSQIKSLPDTCTDLANNDDQCSWSGRECVDGYEKDDGSCLYEQNTYTCVDNSNAWVEVPVESTCQQILPCSEGDECDVRTSGENTDFAEVVSQLAVVSEMRNYMNCSDNSDANTCEVFVGKKRYCSYDQFGLIDCCEEFKGRTIDLFQMATNMMSLASFADSQFGISESMGNAMFGTDGTIIGEGEGDGWVPNDWWGVADTGAWKSIESAGDTFSTQYDAFTNDPWGYVTSQTADTHSNQLDNTKGDDSERPTQENGSAGENMWVDYLTEKLKSKIKAEVINYASKYIVNLLPEAMKAAIIEAGKSMGLGAASGGAGSTTAASVVAEGIATVAVAMAWIAAAYAVVQIALALYQKFNGCKDEEMDMPQEIKGKKCLFAYKQSCNKKFGICMNKHKDKYCCFESVLSRIIVSQAIQQPEPFGTSYSPTQWYNTQQCRGLSIAEVALVDFSIIDLSEWYELAVQSGTLPDGQDTLVEWTKDNSYVNPYGRSDTASLQELRDQNDAQTTYREAIDAADTLNSIECSDSSNLQGCQTGIFAD